MPAALLLLALAGAADLSLEARPIDLRPEFIQSLAAFEGGAAQRGAGGDSRAPPSVLWRTAATAGGLGAGAALGAGLFLLPAVAVETSRGPDFCGRSCEKLLLLPAIGAILGAIPGGMLGRWLGVVAEEGEAAARWGTGALATFGIPLGLLSVGGALVLAVFAFDPPRMGP